MKRYLTNIFTTIGSLFRKPELLALWLIAGLIIPNIVLCFTEGDSALQCIASVFLPLGIYSLTASWIRRTGICVYVLFPFIFFAAFQIVLLHLYGEGLVAVDMFLNVFTTSFSEATELLSNLVMALTAVCVLYLSVLIWGAVAWCRRWMISGDFAKRLRVFGAGCITLGMAAVIAGYAMITDYNPIRSIFPANVIDNLCEAVNRTSQMRNYETTSDGFSYGAVSGLPRDTRELYVIVIGETGRAADWQLGGYERGTNPNLSKMDKLVYFHKSFSESNTTHKSVPMLISTASAENFDSIYRYKSIITAFKEAGFHTAFFSVQTPNRSYTQFFADEADTTVYVPGGELSSAHDGELLPLLSSEIGKSHNKQLIVLHTYGSHFKYSDRYPAEFARFTPDHCVDANAGNRKKLINAYDNTILYTDYILSQVIALADSADCRAAVIYSTDHGEDIFDDRRKRFLHASPNPTAMQIHVPVLCWVSDECNAQTPALLHNLRSNSNSFVSPQKSLCMTLLDIAMLNTAALDRNLSLASEGYTPSEPVYLTDRNKAVPWKSLRFKEYDTEYLKQICGDEIFNKTASAQTANPREVTQNKNIHL